MKICKEHWDMMRESVKDHGLWHLVAKSGQEVVEREVRDLKGERTKDEFEPLMSHHWHWVNGALSAGGLYLMDVDENDPKRKNNEGHYCPVCEFISHYEDFKPKEEIDKVSAQMKEWCVSEGLA